MQECNGNHLLIELLYSLRVRDDDRCRSVTCACGSSFAVAVSLICVEKKENNMLCRDMMPKISVYISYATQIHSKRNKYVREDNNR